MPEASAISPTARSAGVRIGAVIVATCVAGCVPNADPPTVEVSGAVVASPICPVERQPPDPDCAPRPVSGASLTFADPDGEVVGTAVTDEVGEFLVSLPMGTYVVTGERVEGLAGEPPPMEIDVGPAGMTDLVLEYDTGIR
ncbi:MAG: carboxypeptidase-like regulatory domain-containing protein [Chloroflexi bacterium]|nr:carboxypeptidase-like regulatory domain-containing protein [Chloroflexota bacterium]